MQLALKPDEASVTDVDASTAQPPLLEVHDLGVEFRTRSGVVHALENVGFSVAKGEMVGLVGESGSGKSVMCYALLGILDAAWRVTSGSATSIPSSFREDSASA